MPDYSHGKLKNLNTGEEADVILCLEKWNLKIQVIIRVDDIEFYHLPDDSFELNIICKALDDGGNTSDCEIYYFYKTESEKKLIPKYEINNYYRAEGRYTLSKNSPEIFLDDPVINELTDDFLEAAKTWMDKQ
ncbi:MAG TPA: hypothetical protein DC057_03905 [Spirochaetia bacterium]|nr:hypothetical protein [Spirochaetia bacterium]